MKKEEAFHLGRRFDGGEGVGHTLLYYDNVSPPPFAQNFSTSSNLQPFDIFAAASLHSSSKSPEGIMATTSVAFPFTCAQWKELERQAMIYKYMIYSVPVPSDLLLPLPLPLPLPAVDSSMYTLRYSKNGDPEPGRCKRTDGKKWRCSKEVAPNQKYCERHLHRGRPRSRKHVEDNKTNENSTKKQRNLNTSNQFSEKPLLPPLDPKNDVKNVSSAPSCNRDLSLMMMESELKRQRLIETNLGYPNPIYGGSSSLCDQEYVDQHQLNALSTYSNFDTPISFLDTWSVDNGNVESSGPREPESHSPSLSLSISMDSGRNSDLEMARVTYCDDQSVNDLKKFGTVYGGPFARGGPLAEAFKYPASPRDLISTMATTVESPTGVLHRTLFSHSDGSSVCNSPTFPVPMSEGAFRWLN